MTFYLHVGASKTASTTLQGRFFPAHPDIFFLGKEESTLNSVKCWRSPEVFSLVNDINRRNLDFGLDDATVEAVLNDIRRNHGARPIVYSYEDICEFTGPSPFEKLARFQKVFAEFGPIRIIMGVREQLALLKSLYLTVHRSEMLHIPGEKMSWHPTFEQYVDINFRYAYGAVFESFRFSVVLDHYTATLGPENVFVYSYEDFRRDPAAVLRRLCRFMAIDENAACIEETAVTKENQHHSARRYLYLKLRWLLVQGRSVGQWVPAVVKSLFWRWVDSGRKFDFTPSEAVACRIKEYYRADNDALAQKYGIRL